MKEVKLLNIIVCVDDKFGISFMGRRVSRDRSVTEDIIRTVRDKKIYIHPDSAVLFSDFSDKVISNENYLKKAGTGDFCFIENSDYKMHIKSIESVILYKWNRRYPANIFFDQSIIDGREPTKVYNFKGNSHENITKEVYKL